MRWFVVLLVLALPGAGAQTFTLTSHDGTALHAQVYTANATGDVPAILLTHGWGEDIESSTTVAFAQRMADAGYLVVAYDSRGFGKSGGEVELDGPNEVKDVQAFIDHIATLDGVLLDGPGDPRVGMVGQSYAGGIQILAAQEDPRIDAIAPFTAWSNLLQSLAPQDVLKRGWIDLLFASGHASSRGIPLGSTDPGAYDPNGLDPLGGPSSDLSLWYAAALANNGPTDDMRQEIGVVRSLQPGTLNTPTFLAQGWPDTLFTPDDALATFRDLSSRGVDVRLALFHGGHGGFGAYATDEDVMAALDDFLAHHLRGDNMSLPPYPVLRHRYHEDDMVGEMRWPPAGTQARFLHITDDGLQTGPGPLGQTLLVPPAPSQCTEVSNFQSQTGSQCGQGIDGTAWTATTQPLTAPLEITGTPQVLLSVSTTQSDELFLFFHLVDIAPDGSEEPVLAQVTPVRVSADAPAVLQSLATVTHLFEQGHSIGLRIASTDLTYHGSREPGEITLGGTEPNLVVLPQVPQDAWGDRQPPTIERVHSFESALDGDNQTQVLRFRVRDDLGLGAVEVTSDGASLDVSDISSSLRERLIEVVASAPCETATITVAVADLAGNAVERETPVVPCAPEAELVAETPEKKTVGPMALLPLALAGLLRRRR